MSKYVGKIVTNQAPAGYSVYFDGSGDYLSVPSNAAFTWGSGDFTIEAWVYPTATASGIILGSHEVGVASGWYLSLGLGTTVYWGSFGYGGTDGDLTWTTTIPTSRWTHLALVRSGNTLNVYINGTLINSQAFSKNISSIPYNPTIGADQNGDEGVYTGYISNLRAVKGTALYTAAFTPPTQLLNVTNTSLLTCNSPAIVDQSSNAFAITVNGNAAVSTFTPFTAYVPYNPALGASTPGVWTLDEAMQAAATRQWNMYDPYFQNTTLLLHGNGTNAAQNNTFLDSSSNNFTITRNGNTTQGSFSPFSNQPGAWSNYFDGADSLSVPYNSAFDYGTGDFTFEAWAYLTTTPGAGYAIIGSNASGGTNFAFRSSTQIALGSNGVAWRFTSNSTTFPVNTWIHLAVSRASGVAYIWLNGVSIGSGSETTSFNAQSAAILVGDSGDAGEYIGYLSNVRILKGTALYTSAFTPPTTPLTAITNTSLLTCQSNRFIDNSTNAFAITVAGNPSVQPFSPFYPTAAYTPATVGGSGYFDGTGDWLTLPSNNAFNNLSGTTFTLEFWMYPTAYAAGTGFNEARAIFSTAGTFPNGFRTELNTTSIVWYDYVGSVRISFAVPINAWTHIAFTYSSNTLTMYVNGVSRATASSVTWNNSSTNALIGALNSVSYIYPFQGYLQDLRLVSAVVYSGNFTPPTRPLATSGAASAASYPSTTNVNTSFAASATSLLTNFTNAGIVDSTAKNVLETVGNAQISTTQSKFGGSSMYFDGTGDYLVTPFTQLFNMWQGDSTVECWAYFNSLANTPHIWTIGESASYRVTLYVSGSVFRLYTRVGASAGDRITSTTTLSTGRWYHVALTKNGGTWTLWLDGISQGTSTTTVFPFGPAENLGVGFQHYDGISGDYLNGYIDDLRITRGVARYTANFTPQTSQWQDQ